MTMPVIAIIAATICQTECKEIKKKNWYPHILEQAIEDFLKVARCFLNPNYLLYITVQLQEGSVLTRNQYAPETSRQRI